MRLCRPPGENLSRVATEESAGQGRRERIQAGAVGWGVNLSPESAEAD